MANSLGLFIEQNTKLVISPQMYQALEMIQLSVPELLEYINKELVENPLLEAEDFSKDNEAEEKEPQESDQWLDSVFDEVLQEEKDNWTFPRYQPDQEENARFEGYWFDNSSLHEYLMEQLRFIAHRSKLCPDVFSAAEFIIGNLDSNGYLTIPMQEVINVLQIPEKAAFEGLSLVQQLDPPGVGARDLKECLRLQFSLLPECPPQMELLLDYLDDLALGHWKKIANALKVSTEQVRFMGELLRLLDPKPGSRYDRTEQIRYIVPDAMIKKIGDEYVVVVNESDIPRITINESYKRALEQQEGQEVKKFLKDKLQSAINLLKNIENRRATIHSVLEAVVKRQRDFLEYGASALKPLTMREIAEELGLHESTVSRVVSNKYVQTPRGLCSIKCFFAGSIGQTQEVTPERIKEDIKKFIAQEDPKKPYSDQALAELFQKNGIEIARRTIAKYREELGIPSSTLRRITYSK